MSLLLQRRTDHDGRYEFMLGPGKYEIRGPGQDRPESITIPTTDRPSEIVRDFRKPLPKVGPLVIRVVDDRGEPVAGAIVNGQYTSREFFGWFEEMETNSEGRIDSERSFLPLALHAVSADGKFAGMVNSDAKATEARIVVGPAAVATGRLLDLGSQVVAGRGMTYGIEFYMGEPGKSAFQRRVWRHGEDR